MINNERFIKAFNTLPKKQQKELLKQLQLEVVDENKILAQRQLKPIADCPHCDSTNIIKFGQYNGANRYRCKNCGKTFNDLTGTSVSCIKKKKSWLKSIELMLQSKSIRDAAKELKVSTKTVFDWRHKVLVSLENIFTKEFKGIVEMDDIFLNFNQKGRRNRKLNLGKTKRGISDQKTAVMLLTDRYQTLDMKVTTLGRISKEDLDRVIDYTRLNEDNIICSDSHRSIKMYVKSLGLKHKTINVNKGEHVKEKIYHVQKVNSLTSEFKLWMRYHFRNVSTKYLQNYLYWFKMNKILKKQTDGLDEFLSYAITDERAFMRKLEIESDYQKFLNNSLKKRA
ncbi:MAG TPA: IS1595 family transposase [Chitinophagales bacterium]|nr:IS1595 family transposase [Chitinophagales bacterium]